MLQSLLTLRRSLLIKVFKTLNLTSLGFDRVQSLQPRNKILGKLDCHAEQRIRYKTVFVSKITARDYHTVDRRFDPTGLKSGHWHKTNVKSTFNEKVGRSIEILTVPTVQLMPPLLVGVLLLHNFIGVKKPTKQASIGSRVFSTLRLHLVTLTKTDLSSVMIIVGRVMKQSFYSCVLAIVQAHSKLSELTALADNFLGGK